ncbi:hypothetical protein TIFTF001_036055 [Ficus carica]|uniref:Uncharacterized protein n=1 Tax=Ficus carica TaxID=3494 RepID=A0AA88EBY0_FICCA|nr:hypothetical protein TIFTF001_036055 [Ficus carica]
MGYGIQSLDAWNKSLGRAGVWYLLVGHRTPGPRENTFELHGDGFDGEMASWTEETCFDPFGHVVWLLTGEVSPRSRIGYMSNPLELFLRGVGGNLFTIGLLVSIDWSFPSIVVVLLKESYVCSIIGVPF